MDVTEVTDTTIDRYNIKRITASDIYLPQTDFEKWAVIACDQFVTDKVYWERVAKAIGNAQSTFESIIPEAFSEEMTKEQIFAACKSKAEAFSPLHLKKIDNSGVFVKRKTTDGIRYGIVAAVDLEQFSADPKDRSGIVASEAVISERLTARVLLREAMPFEFSHTILFFDDKHDKIVKYLNSIPLDRLYSFELMESGGHIEGYYLTEQLVDYVNQNIRSQIFVADGNHSLSAAKKYWNALKATLPKEQYENHPARFHLAELVNIHSDSIKLYPIHRLITGIDQNHFYEYFSQAVQCVRSDNLLILNSADKLKTLDQIDTLIDRYVRQYGGQTEYIHDDAELKNLSSEHAIGIKLKPFYKDEILLHLKRGKLLPHKAFSLGKATDKRYYIEGRRLK